MRINKAEVKTIYTIEYTFGDFIGAFNAPKYLRIGRDRAFEGLPEEYNEDAFEEFHGVFERDYGVHADTYRVIAAYFGFDGVENCGFYNKSRDVRDMVVYKRGDALQNR